MAGMNLKLILTARQIEAATLIANGATNKQAASKMGVSIKTIEKHRQPVYNKCGVHNAAKLVHLAVREGLIQLQPAP